MFESLGYSQNRRSVYSSYEYNGTSKFLIYLTFGVVLLAQLFCFGLMGYWTKNIMPGWWILVCLIPAFGGVFITASKEPIFSFIGGILCASALGAITGPTFSHYKLASIMNVALYTAAITVCMTVAAAVFRNAFAGLGGILFGGLSLLIFGDFVSVFLSFMGFDVRPAFTFLDIIGVVLFSVYIGYDMHRLNDEAYTIDDAIDISVHVFLDIINLLLSLLSLLYGGDSDSD